MIKLAITGICGRMGSSIYRCLQGNENTAIQLTVATTVSGDKAVGCCVREILGGQSEVIITDSLSNDFDVLIDFTSVASTLSHIDFCRQQGKAIVIGTTGFNDDELAAIQRQSTDMPIFLSANMSLGVNIIEQLVAIAAKSLHQQADIEIVEAHHKHKVDAPSGTALMLGRSIADAIGVDLSTQGVFAREGITGEREAGSIGFSTIRGGDVVGEHTAYYYMAGERIEITHRATDRQIFARGALFAAAYMAKQANGLYNMSDALGLESR